MNRSKHGDYPPKKIASPADFTTNSQDKHKILQNGFILIIIRVITFFKLEIAKMGPWPKHKSRKKQHKNIGLCKKNFANLSCICENRKTVNETIVNKIVYNVKV